MSGERETVAKFLEWWINDHVPARVATRTLPSYRQKVVHVVRILGHVATAKAELEAATRERQAADRGRPTPLLALIVREGATSGPGGRATSMAGADVRGPPPWEEHGEVVADARAIGHPG